MKEKKGVVPHVLHTIADAVVPDGWHTAVAALVEFTEGHFPAAVLLPPLNLPVNKTTGCLFI
jgi:hypothetical protein